MRSLQILSYTSVCYAQLRAESFDPSTAAGRVTLTAHDEFVSIPLDKQDNDGDVFELLEPNEPMRPKDGTWFGVKKKNFGGKSTLVAGYIIYPENSLLKTHYVYEKLASFDYERSSAEKTPGERRRSALRNVARAKLNLAVAGHDRQNKVALYLQVLSLANGALDFHLRQTQPNVVTHLQQTPPLVNEEHLLGEVASTTKRPLSAWERLPAALLVLLFLLVVSCCWRLCRSVPGLEEDLELDSDPENETLDEILSKANRTPGTFFQTATPQQQWGYAAIEKGEEIRKM